MKKMMIVAAIGCLALAACGTREENVANEVDAGTDMTAPIDDNMVDDNMVDDSNMVDNNMTDGNNMVDDNTTDGNNTVNAY